MIMFAAPDIVKGAAVIGMESPVPGKSLLTGNKSAHQIEKFRNKKESFLDQYVLDSSQNLRASLRWHL